MDEVSAANDLTAHFSVMENVIRPYFFMQYSLARNQIVGNPNLSDLDKQEKISKIRETFNATLQKTQVSVEHYLVTLNQKINKILEVQEEQLQLAVADDEENSSFDVLVQGDVMVCQWCYQDCSLYYNLLKEDKGKPVEKRVTTLYYACMNASCIDSCYQDLWVTFPKIILNPSEKK